MSNLKTKGLWEFRFWNEIDRKTGDCGGCTLSFKNDITPIYFIRTTACDGYMKREFIKIGEVFCRNKHVATLPQRDVTSMPAFIYKTIAELDGLNEIKDCLYYTDWLPARDMSSVIAIAIELGRYQEATHEDEDGHIECVDADTAEEIKEMEYREINPIKGFEYPIQTVKLVRVGDKL